MRNSRTAEPAILLFAIGNTGRRDDGLGWCLADWAARDWPGVDCEYRYQLQVEDALLLCRYDTVIFADASHAELPMGYELKSCTAAPHYFYSSHMQSPETILYLAKELYRKTPAAYTLAIAGSHWGLGTGLSRKAEQNLEKALRFLQHEWKPVVAEVS